MSAAAPAAAAAAAASSLPSTSARAASSSAGSAAWRPPEELPPNAQPPSLLSANSLDPLSLILSFALIDLPVALGQPYFPKELVRIVHEYASEPCFVAELSDSTGSVNRIELDSTSAFLRWLGGRLPLAPDPTAAWDAEYQWIDQEDPVFSAQSDSCLMDEHTRSQYGEDISRLLNAQLKDHEYRACYLEIESNDDGASFEPREYWAKRVDLSKHGQFCLEALNMRKAAITASGQKSMPVGLNELLNRVRVAFEENKLPCGLSPRPSDWAPLFRWICGFQEVINDYRRDIWAGDHSPGVDCPFEPQLHAIAMQLRYKDSD